MRKRGCRPVCVRLSVTRNTNCIQTADKISKHSPGLVLKTWLFEHRHRNRGRGCGGPGPPDFLFEGAQYDRGPLRFFGMYPAMGVALYRRGVMDNLAR